jgi:DNA-binding SARP family transcriptional activator/predicted ATPase
MVDLRVSLFGVPRLERDGEDVPIRRRKTVALLAYLAVTNQQHSRDALAALFWPEHDTSSARANLRRDLSRLKRALGAPALSIDRANIGLHPEAGLSLDVAAFQNHLKAVQQHDHQPPELCEACLAHLTQAVELYVDDFMAGFHLPDSLAFDDWQFFQAESLRQGLADALQHLALWHGSQEDFDQAIAYGRRWMAMDPLHEPAQRQLMELYALSGQQAAALRQYQEFAQLLEEELDVPPDEETTAVYEAIRTRQVRVVGAERNGLTSLLTPEETAPPQPPNNLPASSTPFVGREEELAAIRGLLLDEPGCRLLTLAGPGGIGKTRLALEVGAAVLEQFTDGVYFVPLASVSEPCFIVPAMAEAMDVNLSGAQDPEAELLDTLQAKKLLLLVDNFEHVTAGADLLSEIVRAAASVKLLVTSRERLNLLEEWVFEVRGLTCPPPSDLSDATEVEAYSAARLFLQRARQARASFDLAPADIPALVQICKMVDGMPLGLELAASWVRYMSCREIADEVARSLDFLSTKMRNVPQRHRSLRAVFEQSWERLPGEEQAVLKRLAVFRGGCLRQAAEAVANARLPRLSALVDKALLRYERNGRYEMHELIRQFALERLQSEPEEYQRAQHEHGQYFTTFVEKHTASFRGGRQSEALAEIAAEMDNIRAAWRHTVADRHLESLEALHRGLAMFYWLQGWFAEARDTFRLAIEALKADADPPAEQQRILVELLVSFSTHSQFQGKQGPAEAALEEALALAERLDAPDLIAAALERQARLANEQGDHLRAKMLGEKALSLYRDLGDVANVAHVLSHQGRANLFLQDFDTAREHLEASAAYYRQQNNLPELTVSLNNLARVLLKIGAFPEAKRIMQEIVALNEQMETPIHASAYNNLGQLAEAEGDYDLARQYYLNSIEYCEKVRNELWSAIPLALLGNLARMQGDYDRARRLLNKSLQISQKYIKVREAAQSNLLLAQVAVEIGDDEAAHAKYHDSLILYETDENREGIALALNGLAQLAVKRGDLVQAGEYFRGALERAAEIGAHPLTTQILLHWAKYQIRLQRVLEAIQVLAFLAEQSNATHETRIRAKALLAQQAARDGARPMPGAQPSAKSVGLAEMVTSVLEGTLILTG